MSLESSRSFELSGLPVGPITARLVRREEGAPDLVLAERVVHVEMQSPATLELDLDALPNAKDLGEIMLSVTVMDELALTTLEASVERLDGGVASGVARMPLSRMERGDDGTLRWHLGERRAGIHRISLSPGSTAVEVLLPPKMHVNATLVTPTLATLRLWITDAATESPVVPQRVMWRPTNEADSTAWRAVNVRAQQGPLDLALGAGRVDVAVRADGYSTKVRTIDIVADWNEDLITLLRSNPREILVRLESGGFEVPAPEETWSGTTAKDASGRAALLSVSMKGTRLREGGCAESALGALVVDGPGTYEVAIGRVPGFKLPAAKTIIVGEDTATITIELARELGALDSR